MKLTIEPTKQFFMAGDVMVRLWQGTSDTGTPIAALVAGVYFADQAAAMAEHLVPIPAPDPEAARRWAEHILFRPGDAS